ncbi:MAG: hypothetical protein MUF51_02185, partial [Vicinamibacteria bacterium]|nr:hypothetical protein [Vicinamibacteria bacterium]
FAALSEPKRPGAGASNKIRLTAEEERVYRKVDGTRTVQAIIESTGLSEFDACRVLFDLLNRSIIAPAGRGMTREHAEAAFEAAPRAIPNYAVVAVVVLISLLALLLQWRSPFGLVGRGSEIEAGYISFRQGLGMAHLNRLDRALMAYCRVHGSAPRTLRPLVDEGLVDSSFLLDSSGRPYHYAITDNGYLLSAVDPNGKTISGSLIQRILTVETR